MIFWSANRWWWIVENRQNTKDKYVNVDWVNIYHAHGFDNTTKLVFAEQTIILIQPPQHNRLGSSQYSDFNGSNTIADTTAQCAVYQFKFKFFLLWMWQSNNINMYIQHARATWTFAHRIDRSDAFESEVIIMSNITRTTQLSFFHSIISKKWWISNDNSSNSSTLCMLPLLISLFSAACPWCWTGHPLSSITAIGRGCHLHTSLASYWRRRHYFTPRPGFWLVERCQHSHLAPGHYWPLATTRH